MRSFTVKNISALLLLTFGLMVWGSGMVKGQTCSGSVRVYNSSQVPSADEYLLLLVKTGYVENATNVIDNDLQTYSTLNTTAVNILGAKVGGSSYQILNFPSTDLPPTKDTPVTVKIGTGSSLLGLLDGVTIQATMNNTPVGPAYKKAALLGLLSGTNQSEVTFVPGVVYNGVKVSLNSDGALLSIGLLATMQVYHAYFTKTVTNYTKCEKPVDVLSGVGSSDLGVNLATITGGVTNPSNAIDGNDATVSTINIGVQALAFTQLTALFESPSQSGDSIRIVISTPGGLALGVLSNFQIQAYNGFGITAGPLIQGDNSLLKISLSAGNSKAVITFLPSTATYDRIQIRLASAVGLLSSLNIHEIQRIANTKITGSNINNKITVCAGQNVTLPSAANSCTTFEWYDAPVGGAKVATGLILTTNSSSPAQKTYYIQPVRYGCSSMTRGIATVVVTPHPPTPNVTISSN
jgi:hypothetical protein